MHKICSPHGKVLRIAMIRRTGTQALVEFDSVPSAVVRILLVVALRYVDCRRASTRSMAPISICVVALFALSLQRYVCWKRLEQNVCHSRRNKWMCDVMTPTVGITPSTRVSHRCFCSCAQRATKVLNYTHKTSQNCNLKLLRFNVKTKQKALSKAKNDTYNTSKAIDITMQSPWKKHTRKDVCQTKPTRSITKRAKRSSNIVIVITSLHARTLHVQWRRH